MVLDEAVKQILSLLGRRGLRSPARLAIMLYLLPKGKAYFGDILLDLSLSPGNLWSHIEKLRSEGYIETRYVIADRPRVQVVLTDKGFRVTWQLLAEIKKYISRLEHEGQKHANMGKSMPHNE